MKKSITVLMLAAGLAVFGGCAEDEAVPAPVIAADGSCIVKYKDAEYDCSINFLSSDVETITVNSPSSLKGLTFRRGEDAFSVSYGTLLCRNITLPIDSFPCVTADAVHKVRQTPESFAPAKTENGYSFSSKQYSFETDKNGVIKYISL